MTKIEEVVAVHEENPSRTNSGPWTPEEERKLVWKIDFRLLPMLCIIFGLSLLDRTNISAAYIAGLDNDIKIKEGSRYSIALLVFFIGYAIFQLPSNMVIRRMGTRTWLSGLIVAWGVMVLSMGFVHDWRTLTLLRALLGCFEAGIFPGAIFIIGSWYRQFEAARRISLFYMAALLASGFGPIFAYVLSLIRVGDGVYRQGWRWIFIVEGVTTIVAGLIAPFFLIEFPEKAGFLDAHELHIAQTRIRLEKESKQVKHLTWSETCKVIMQWKVVVFSIQYFVAASSVYSMAFFTPIILRSGMGFSYAKAQLLSSPPYVFTIAASIMLSYVSDKTRMRWPILITQSVTALVGLLVVLYAKAPGIRYFGLFLAVFGTQANVPSTLAYGQNQAARQEDKGVIAAVMISVGAAGGIAGSSIFRAQDAPTYLPGMWTTIAMQMLYCILTFGFSMYLRRQNKLADAGKKPALEGLEGFRYAP